MIVTDDEIQNAEKALGFELYDWQKDYLRNILGGAKLVTVSRRGGKRMVWQAAEHIVESRKEGQ